MADPALLPRAGEFSPPQPMGYLQSFGPRADPVTSLTWGLTGISLAVTAIIIVLVAAGTWRRARQPGPEAFATLNAERPAGGMRWIWIGVALTVVALAVSMIWTVAVVAQVDSPPGPVTEVIEVSGHQWWWEATYGGARPGEGFVTANEIHVPVGRPVLLKLTGADVIHSFWIPSLTGKTDTIPGRANLAWLQADRPGVYRGQCTEYCGEQHAHMAAYVVADLPGAYAAWRQAQVRAAAPPAGAQAQLGAQLFVARCGGCHTVRGTDAGGAVGPDLTHLMSRRTLAAGTLPNTVATLDGWIANPQALKPGARMPATWLTSAELAQLTAYLESLT